MTTKKWLISLGITAALGGSTAAYAAGITGNDSANDSVKTVEGTAAGIGIVQAKEMALKQVNGSLDSIELEHKHSQPYYEAEIVKADHTEAEVQVDAISGKVLKVTADDDRDSDDDSGHDKSDKSSSGTQSSVGEKTVISEKQAAQIAADAVKGQVVKTELDHEDEGLQYEIKLTTSQGKVEVEVSASDGSVLSIDYDDQD